MRLSLDAARLLLHAYTMIESILAATDWNAVAADVLSRVEEGAVLHDLVQTDIAGFSSRDVLVSYAFAAFLVEAHGVALPRIVERVGLAEDPVRVLEAELECELPALERRFRAWLTEYAERYGPPPVEDLAEEGDFLESEPQLGVEREQQRD